MSESCIDSHKDGQRNLTRARLPFAGVIQVKLAGGWNETVFPSGCPGYN